MSIRGNEFCKYRCGLLVNNECRVVIKLQSHAKTLR